MHEQTMQVTTEPKTLTAALKAVQAFVSKDPTRTQLGQVLVERVPSGVKLTATDGHTLCSVSVIGAVEGTGPVRLTPIAVETALLRAKACKDDPSAVFDLEDSTSEGTFPDYARVVPARADKAKGTVIQGFNGEYLARIGSVQKTLKAVNARCQFSPDGLGPLRADIVGGHRRRHGNHYAGADMSDAAGRSTAKEWIQTFTGEKFFPLRPRHQDIVLEDIAHALSNVCRYTGHVCRFYSVAEHSVLVSLEVERRAVEQSVDARQVRNLARWGLLHDASEAYIADVSRPLKQLPAFDEYRAAEAHLQSVIAERFGLSPDGEPPEVKAVDYEILANEVEALMPNVDRVAWGATTPAGVMPDPLPFVHVVGMDPCQAEQFFLTRFQALWGGR
jgi:hypothetical protein